MMRDEEADGRPEAARGGDADARGRVIALLQGPSSYFFDLVGDALRARGAEAFRICFCAGDRLFWRRKPSVFFRGRLTQWPARLGEIIADRGVTDLLMLGDARPRHRAAIALAARRGVAAHVVEHGYFRPDWLTHEIGGMAARSPFRAAWRGGAVTAPSDEETARAAAPDRAVFKARFAEYAAMDVAYNLTNVATRWVAAPAYAGHSNVPPPLEYAGWLRKLAVARRRAAQAQARVTSVLARPEPIYVWALQLETDYQVREAAGGSQKPVIAPLLAAFARGAPPEARLIVKAHPLDNMLISWERRLARAAAEAGLGARVVFIDGGDLEALLGRAAGVTLVNSSVGFRALALGAPVFCLGEALYELPGLAASAPLAEHALADRLAALEAFFRAPQRPDPGEAARFLAALKRDTQFRGGFDGEGAAPGAERLAERILTRGAAWAQASRGASSG